MPDYMFMLESRLSAEQRAVVMRIQELAAVVGANVYLAGGAVRDLISGMPIRDLDFAIEGNPSRLARELEKGGAQILSEDERLRHVELIFAGDVDGSIAAARDDVYYRPGTKPEIRWSSIMEDLRRRDFSLNAIAISLNPASRGLLLDPTNGLADIEKREVRALSIHSFTNQPARLPRIVRYCVRLGFKMEQRTSEWFDLALERDLHETIPPAEVGMEVRQLGREEKPAAILKAWESRGLIGAIHPQLVRRHPHYDRLNRVTRVRDDMVSAGFRPRLFAPVTHALLGRLKPREQSTAMHRMEFRQTESSAVVDLDSQAAKVVKMLTSRKTASPVDAYAFLEKIPLYLLAHILAEFSNAKALGKIRNYLRKWKPIRLSLPSAAAELESLGLPRGPKFDKVIAELFALQLQGKARSPEDRTKLLRRLAGIKEPPKKKEKEKKKPREKGGKKSDKESTAAPTDVRGAAEAPVENLTPPAATKAAKLRPKQRLATAAGAHGHEHAVRGHSPARGGGKAGRKKPR